MNNFNIIFIGLDTHKTFTQLAVLKDERGAKPESLTNRNWGITMSKQINSLNRYLRGWGNYFLIANGYQLCVDLDQWIRRRIRMCYWRQWRKPRTKVKNLLKRGVPLALAVSCGATRKGAWRSAKTKGINQALSNVYGLLLHSKPFIINIKCM